MKTDTKPLGEKIKKCSKRKNLKNLRRLGNYHFHTRVPFDQGPQFHNKKDNLEWQRGWKQAEAYEQGYKTGLAGNKAKKNPNNSKSKPENSKLSRWWKSGLRAAACVMELYKT